MTDRRIITYDRKGNRDVVAPRVDYRGGGTSSSDRQAAKAIRHLKAYGTHRAPPSTPIAWSNS